MENFYNTYNKIQQFMHGGGDGLSMADDPTYLTFSLDFNFHGQEYGGTGLYNSPLFIGNEFPDVSAETFLKARNFKPQAERLAKFKEVLKKVYIESPWYFQTIKGLDKLWLNGTTMSNNFKGKEAVLEISTLESFDLKIAYLADLYRKSVFDGVYMRELVPRNLRYFEVDIYVAEFRHIQSLELGADSDIGARMYANSDYFEKFATFYLFKCYQCEFDFGNSIPGGGEFSVAGFDTPAANSFKIKVGYFLEQHQFSFFDILTGEKFSQHNYRANNNTNEWNNKNVLDGITGAASVALNALQNNAIGNALKSNGIIK